MAFEMEPAKDNRLKATPSTKKVLKRKTFSYLSILFVSFRLIKRRTRRKTTANAKSEKPKRIAAERARMRSGEDKEAICGGW